MKYWKIIITTLCFVLLSTISVLGDDNEHWSWEVDDYHYELIKIPGYEEWNDTDVNVFNDLNTSYITFLSGPIEGELAQFSIGICDLEYNYLFNYDTSSGLSHTMTLRAFHEIGLSPGQYKLSIVAKGFIDQSLDDYTLYVSYVGSDDNYEEIVTDDNNEVTTDKNNHDEVTTNENNNTSTDKVEENEVPSSDNNSATLEDNNALDDFSLPKKISLQSAERLKTNRKKIKLKWKKLGGNNIKYEIVCSTTKKFTKKTTKVYITKKATYTISKLSKKKKYYVRVRGFKIIDGIRTYGTYSKIKTIGKAK